MGVSAFNLRVWVTTCLGAVLAGVLLGASYVSVASSTDPSESGPRLAVPSEQPPPSSTAPARRTAAAAAWTGHAAPARAPATKVKKVKKVPPGHARKAAAKKAKPAKPAKATHHAKKAQGKK